MQATRNTGPPSSSVVCSFMTIPTGLRSRLDDRFHESCHFGGFIRVFGFLYRRRGAQMEG